MRYCGGTGRVALWCVLVVAPAALPAGPAAAQEFTNEVYADADVRVEDQSLAPPVDLQPDHAESASRLTNPPGSATPSSFAEARASADRGGPFRTFAAVGGTASDRGDFDAALEAEAFASQLTDYRVESATLPAGTPVRGTLNLHFSGSLDLSHAPGASFPHRRLVAEIDAFVQLIGTGKMYEGGAGLYGDGVQFDYGDWEGDVTFTDHGGGHRSATVDITESMEFDTAVGDEFQFLFDLIAHAQASGATGVSATADFFDTATFSFTAPEGVSFAVLPEPATPALFLIGCAAALKRRR